MKKIVGLLLVLSMGTSCIKAVNYTSLVLAGAAAVVDYSVIGKATDIVGLAAGTGAFIVGYKILKQFNIIKSKKAAYEVDMIEKQNFTKLIIEAPEIMDKKLQQKRDDCAKAKINGYDEKINNTLKQINEALGSVKNFGFPCFLLFGFLSSSIMIKNNNYYIAPAALFSSFALARIL